MNCFFAVLEVELPVAHQDVSHVQILHVIIDSVLLPGHCNGQDDLFLIHWALRYRCLDLIIVAVANDGDR